MVMDSLRDAAPPRLSMDPAVRVRSSVSTPMLLSVGTSALRLMLTFRNSMALLYIPTTQPLQSVPLREGEASSRKGLRIVHVRA